MKLVALQYANIQDAQAPTNILDLPMGILNVWMQPTVLNALLIIGVFLLFIYIAFVWLTHR